jgi:hypothetical protein
MYTEEQKMSLIFMVSWVLLSHKKARRFGGTHNRRLHNRRIRCSSSLICAAFLLGLLFGFEDGGDFLSRKSRDFSELH